MTKCLDELSYSLMCFRIQKLIRFLFLFVSDSTLRLFFDSTQEFFLCMYRVAEGCFFFDKCKELNTLILTTRLLGRSLAILDSLSL